MPDTQKVREALERKINLSYERMDSGKYAGYRIGLREAIALLPALDSEQGERWRPIETAPRDGTTVLLWSETQQIVLTGRVSKSAWHGGKWMNFELRSDGHELWPTHWMPLPPPPDLWSDRIEVVVEP